MLSSDKSVENIAQLIEVLKHYLGLQTEFVKLDLIDKVVRLVTAAALAIVFILVIAAGLTYLSFALAFWLATFTGNALAFFIIALLYLLLLILFFLFRKPWIEKPLVRFLASVLLSK